MLFCVIMIALYMIAGRIPGSAGANASYEGQAIGGDVGIGAADIGLGQ